MNEEEQNKYYDERSAKIKAELAKDESVCPYLGVYKNILFCKILRLNNAEICTAPCRVGNDKDRLPVDINKFNCELLK